MIKYSHQNKYLDLIISIFSNHVFVNKTICLFQYWSVRSDKCTFFDNKCFLLLYRSTCSNIYDTYSCIDKVGTPCSYVNQTTIIQIQWSIIFETANIRWDNCPLSQHQTKPQFNPLISISRYVSGHSVSEVTEPSVRLSKQIHVVTILAIVSNKQTIVWMVLKINCILGHGAYTQREATFHKWPRHLLTLVLIFYVTTSWTLLSFPC